MSLGEAQTKLIDALKEAEAPAVMIDRAIAGTYDDFKSDEAAPILRLVMDAKVYGLKDIAERAKKGEFDATKTDAEAWSRGAGKKYIEQLVRPV